MYYFAAQKFSSLKEAIDSVLQTSVSLGTSDFYGFKGAENFDQLYETMSKYEEEYETSTYPTPNIGMGGVDEEEFAYSKSLTESLGLYKPEGAYYSQFDYETSSGTNLISIIELPEGGYEAFYRVQSEKPIEYSTAMQSFREAGWKCGKEGYLDAIGNEPIKPEEAAKLKEDYEQELIEDMRWSRRIPEMNFYVSWKDFDGIAGIYSHAFSNNPNTILTLLKSHPELSAEVIEYIDEQIAEMDKLEIPTTYDFNDSLYKNSNWYVEQRAAVKDSLMAIKDGIVKEKNNSQSPASILARKKEEYSSEKAKSDDLSRKLEELESQKGEEEVGNN